MKKIFFAFFIMLLTCNIALASESQNVWGYAWSDNIGWISFNCDNVRNGANDCSGSDYGVNIKAGGCFEGFAWSDNLGWISFNQTDTGNPETNETGDTTCLAKAYEDNGTKIQGWARVLSGKDSDTDGFDGWIKFNGTNIDTGINNDNPRKFTGYAWGDVVTGWVKLNSQSSPAETKNFAVYTNYTSTLRPEPPTDLNVNRNQCQYNLTFSWTYNPPAGKTETDYPQRCVQARIKKDNGEYANYEFSGTAESFTISMASFDGQRDQREYTYEIRTNTDEDNGCNLDDSSDKWSDWSPATFKSHPEYPNPIFEFNPAVGDFKIEDLVEFVNNTSNPNNNYIWDWQIEIQREENGPWENAGGTDYTYDVCPDKDGNPINCNNKNKSPKLKFLTLANYRITLEATNPDIPVACDFSQEIRPAYEEIKDIGPDDLEDFMDLLNGSMRKFGARILEVLARPFRGLDF